jgi:DNA-binding GntR family transcriptional regulator
VQAEHEMLFRAAIERREARAALALEDHVRATLELLRQAGSFSNS